MPAGARLKPYRVEHVECDSARFELRISGRLALVDAAALWKELDDFAHLAERGETLNFEMSRVEKIDGSAMAMARTNGLNRNSLILFPLLYSSNKSHEL